MNPEVFEIDSPPGAELARSLLRDGTAVRFAARGRSMTPFVRDGDVVTIAPVHASQLRTGDLVLYRAQGGGLILHRMVALARSPDGPQPVMRGDNQVRSERIRPEQVLGRAEFLMRDGRTRNPRAWARRATALVLTRCRRAWRLLGTRARSD